jgi:hypothetical protein
MSMSELVLLNLVAAPAVEDAIADWLLARSELPGFTSLPVAGHGSSIHSMTLAEQVAGRRRQVLFQCYLPADLADRLIDAVRTDFAGSGLHYWVLPVRAAGHID